MVINGKASGIGDGSKSEKRKIKDSRHKLHNYIGKHIMILLSRIYFVILLFFAFDSYSNILLQKPKELSVQEISDLARKWETEFSWPSIRGLATFNCRYQDGQSGFAVRLLGIPVYSYNYPYAKKLREFVDSMRNHQPNYYFAKPLIINEPNPQRINDEKLLTILKEKKIIFYTGAGISAASNVATMNDLEKLLKMNFGIMHFIKTLWKEPGEIAAGFTKFCRTSIHSQPTPAHVALKTIAQHKSVTILTENVDLLQQRTGVEPIFIFSDQISSANRKDLQEIDCIICCGLSQDDRGFLSWYKDCNPTGLIAAIDIGMPSYLSTHDYIVQDDIQMVLPYLATRLCERKKQ